MSSYFSSTCSTSSPSRQNEAVYVLKPLPSQVGNGSSLTTTTTSNSIVCSESLAQTYNALALNAPGVSVHTNLLNFQSCPIASSGSVLFSVCPSYDAVYTVLPISVHVGSVVTLEISASYLTTWFSSCEHTYIALAV